MERESIQKNDLLLCRGSGIARQGKDIPEKDTCVFSLNGQTIESIVPKKLEFTQEPQTEGREKLKSVPARRETCLSGRDFTQFWQLLGHLAGELGAQTSVAQWWAGPLCEQDYVVVHTSCSLLKPQPYISTLVVNPSNPSSICSSSWGWITPLSAFSVIGLLRMEGRPASRAAKAPALTLTRLVTVVEFFYLYADNKLIA